MKVIGQKIKDVQSMWPKRVFCDECYAELEIEESDVFVGEFGCHLFKCPCCGREVAIDGIILIAHHQDSVCIAAVTASAAHKPVSDTSPNHA